MSLHFIFSNKPNPSPFSLLSPSRSCIRQPEPEFRPSSGIPVFSGKPPPLHNHLPHTHPSSLDSRSDERMVGHHHRWRRSVTATEPPQRQRSCGWRFSGGCGQETVVTGSGSGDDKDDGSAVLFR
ncbi:hypothetical protein HanHA300_Chr14g0518921 [Helianthus annuus]|nr:hypothetical protein HanHA300_Chr14g0518921 [Helianthus annuus]KAJ0485224.1 hypothetical protein HanHA89_Chr14g0565871 [Helianthus annuus]KAJ0655774.1 hypothetical protein HanLR1_Chr14g0528211 [Helianthus annuus]KAJ0659456.1 hypothetical protein HanOQP8_Chr14g0526371 [Helianthus annuus]